MYRQFSRIIFILCFFNFIGCYSFQTLNRYDLEQGFSGDISIRTTAHKTYKFDKGYYRVDKDSLFGIGKMLDNSYTAVEFRGKMAFKDMDMIIGEKVDSGKTLLLVPVLGLAVILVYLLSEVLSY